MNLALGTLYAWSIFVAPLEKEFGWKRIQTSNVFTIAVVVFALSFILAGRLQDKFGPFWVSLTGGVLVSVGVDLAFARACWPPTALDYEGLHRDGGKPPSVSYWDVQTFRFSI